MPMEDLNAVYLLEEGFEDLEFYVPLMRLREEGVSVTVVDTGRKPEYTGKRGLRARPDLEAENVDPADYEAVVIPGGWAPDKLRRSPPVLELVRDLHQENKIIGSICHAGWVPISAGIVEGRRGTGSTGIKDDLENAGGTWVDEPAFRDGNIVWGRVVKDLPQFCRTLVTALREYADERHARGPRD